LGCLKFLAHFAVFCLNVDVPMRKTAANCSCVIYGVRKCSFTIACMLKDCKLSKSVLGSQWSPNDQHLSSDGTPSLILHYSAVSSQKMCQQLNLFCFLDILNSISYSSLTILLCLSASLELRFVFWDMPCSAVEVGRRFGGT
jgi:hypothetical protein